MAIFVQKWKNGHNIIVYSLLDLIIQTTKPLFNIKNHGRKSIKHSSTIFIESF